MEANQIGDFLLERGLIREEQLAQALEVQARSDPPPPLGSVLVAMQAVTEDQLAGVLAQRLGAALCDLDAAPPDPELKDLIPPEIAQAARVIPHARDNGSLRVVAAGPLAPRDRARIEFLAGAPVEVAIAPESAINQQLQELYGLSVERMIASLAQTETADAADEHVYVHDLRDQAQEPTLINLVNMVITSAIEERASDIHIEPFETELKIKYRIDGILHEMPPPPKQFQSAIVSRIKIMAGLDIAERYVPQDGQIRVNLPGSQVDIRVATVPTVYGESVVLRLLRKDESLLKLERLGLPNDTHHRLSRLLHRPFGIILVCGPTGSGKTTTLYSALIEIFTPEKKFITIEDPVEYQIPGINQIPVRPKRGLTFAEGLRAIVRQDPDIIMVGEIRDRETADIAIRSALTGHLVFSTLHTNDAPGSVTRLLDMGCEPFLIASSLQGALGQRLVRRLCEDCRRPVEPEPALAAEFGAHLLPHVIYEPGGCDACHGRGYLGRVGVFELLEMSDRLHDLILREATATEIKHYARNTMQTMRQDGWQKIRGGITTVPEVLQATANDAQE